MKPLYTTEALATGGGRDGHVDVAESDLAFDLAVPTAMGGTGAGAQRPCRSSQYTALPPTAMLPETTALAAAVTPAAASSTTQPSLLQPPRLATCQASSVMCRATTWHCGS